MPPAPAAVEGQQPHPAAPSHPATQVGRAARSRPATWLLAVLIVPVVAVGAALLIALVEELAAPPLAAAHHDFLAFYAAGELVLRGHAGSLYDAAALTSIQRAVIPFPVGANGYMPFINPPFAAVAFAPLAALPEAAARFAWAGINGGVALVAAAWIAWPLPRRERVVGFLLVLASFPVSYALAEGQWSILLLVGSLGALAAFRRGAWAWTGVALALLWLKPQFIVLPLLALVLARKWTVVGWAVAAGAALVLVSLPFTGLAPYEQYAGYLTQVVVSHFNGAGAGAGAGAAAPSVWQGDLATAEGLNGLLVGYLGQGAVTVVNLMWAVVAAGLVGLFGLAAYRQRPGIETPGGRAMLAAGVGLVLLVDPNLFGQDCVLVFVGLAALWPLRDAAALPAVAVTAAVADLVLLDLGFEPWHLFTWVLLVAVVAVCVHAIARGRIGARPLPPAAAPS